MATALNTYAAVRDLEAAGVDPELAEAIVAAIGRSDPGPITHADISALEGRLTASADRLAFTVVVTNAAIIFGLHKLIVPT